VIITETTKPHAACVRNLGARARKTYPGLNSLSCSCHRRGGKGKCPVYCWPDSGKRVFIYL